MKVGDFEPNVGNGIYRQRNAILFKMGYANYSEYLRSDLWKDIRKRVVRSRRSQMSNLSWQSYSCSSQILWQA